MLNTSSFESFTPRVTDDQNRSILSGLLFTSLVVIVGLIAYSIVEGKLNNRLHYELNRSSELNLVQFHFQSCLFGSDCFLIYLRSSSSPGSVVTPK